MPSFRSCHYRIADKKHIRKSIRIIAIIFRIIRDINWLLIWIIRYIWLVFTLLTLFTLIVIWIYIWINITMNLRYNRWLSTYLTNIFIYNSNITRVAYFIMLFNSTNLNKWWLFIIQTKKTFFVLILISYFYHFIY